jgi:hypothetical protein
MDKSIFMGNTERQGGGKEGSIVEVVASFLSGIIKKEDLNENNAVVLEYYLSLVASGEDKKLAAKVHARQQELMASQTSLGRRTQLFSKGELENAKRHQKGRGREVKREALPPSLFPEEPSQNSNFQVFEKNPEKEVVGFGEKMDKPAFRSKKSILAEDVRYNKEELRNRIGLPIARGKDPHINDPFYQYLVRQISAFDIFGIVLEYDRAKHLGNLTEDLEDKINDVGSMVKEVLDKHVGRSQKFKRFHQFVQEYNDKWNGRE